MLNAREIIPDEAVHKFLKQYDRIIKSCKPGKRHILGKTWGPMQPGTIDSKLEALIKKYASIYKP